MNTETVVAVCAVVIAVASFVVSVFEVRATRQHNRHAVRPILQLHHGWPPGGTAGVRLTNVGLGPAVVTRTVLSLDGQVIGAWNRRDVDALRDGLPVRPDAVTFGEREVIPTAHAQYLLSVDGYDPRAHAGLRELVEHRLTLEVRYESLYGGEDFDVTLRPGGDPPGRRAGVTGR